MVWESVGVTIYGAEYCPYGQVQSETGTNPSSHWPSWEGQEGLRDGLKKFRTRSDARTSDPR
jgi:hypothetical protein